MTAFGVSCGVVEALSHLLVVGALFLSVRLQELEEEVLQRVAGGRGA